MAPPKLSLKRRPWAWAGGAALLVIGAILGIRRYQERPLTEFPRPPIPKPFPACPDIPSTAYEWHGLRFRYPSDWSIVLDEKGLDKAGERALFVRPRPKPSMLLSLQSIVLTMSKDSPAIHTAVESVWRLQKGEKIDFAKTALMGPETIPDTIQAARIDGREAVLFLQRGHALLPKEADQWSLLIRGDGVDYGVGGPTLFNPYRLEDGLVVVLDKELESQNKTCECAYWTVVQSLRLP